MAGATNNQNSFYDLMRQGNNIALSLGGRIAILYEHENRTEFYSSEPHSYWPFFGHSNDVKLFSRDDFLEATHSQGEICGAVRRTANSSASPRNTIGNLGSTAENGDPCESFLDAWDLPASLFNLSPASPIQGMWPTYQSHTLNAVQRANEYHNKAI